MLIYRVERENVGPLMNGSDNIFLCGLPGMNKDCYHNAGNPSHPLYDGRPHYLPDGTERNIHPDADIDTPLHDFMFSNKKFGENDSYGFDIKDYIFGFASVKDMNILVFSSTTCYILY